MKIDFEVIKSRAAGRWAEVFQALTPLSGEVLHRGKSDHPCPGCAGVSVIWPDKDAEQTGSIACRKCTSSKPTGDGIATVAKWAGLSQGDAAKAIASYLGIGGMESAATVELDVIELVCKDKRMPIEAFKQFRPTIEKRGRNS